MSIHWECKLINDSGSYQGDSREDLLSRMVNKYLNDEIADYQLVYKKAIYGLLGKCIFEVASYDDELNKTDHDAVQFEKDFWDMYDFEREPEYD